MRDSTSDSTGHIIRSLCHSTCPVIKCSMGFGKRPMPYHLLHEHFIHTHYLSKERHHRQENFVVALLEQLVIFESSKTRRLSHTRRKQLVRHILINHLYISLVETAGLLDKSANEVGTLSYYGHMNCQHCSSSDT